MARNSEPQAVRDGTIPADLIWLGGVLNWATRWQNEDGTYLMREDPTRGYPLPGVPDASPDIHRRMFESSFQ